MHVKRIAVTAITAALLLGACGSSKKSGGAAAPSTTAAAASAAAKTTAAAGGAAAKTTAAAAPATTAAAGGAAATGSFKMAGLYANTSDAFWLSYKCGAIKRAKKLGVDLKTSEIATWDAAKYSTLLDTALLDKPDAILFNPIDIKPYSAKIKEIMDGGTAVVAALQLDPPTQLTWVPESQDATAHAPKVVEALGTKKGSAVILKGLDDAGWQHDRLDGIVGAIKKGRGDLNWLPDLVDGFDVTKGTQQVSSLIVANPDLQLIVAVAGPEGQAAAAAVDQSGKSGQIVVVAFDAVPAEVDALKKGTMSFLVAQPAEDLGGAEVQAAYDYLKANGVKKGTSIKPQGPSQEYHLGLLTKDNVNDPASSGLIYKATCDA